MSTSKNQPVTRAAEYKAANRQYELDWRSTGAVVVTGRANAAKALGLTETSLQCYLSTGRAKAGILRDNPQTGEPDLVTFTAAPAPAWPGKKRAQSTRPRGRPRKQRVEQA